MMDAADDLKRKISTLLLQHDPMRIYFEDVGNRDEYDQRQKS
jgi:hypothetical protein